ncbi:MAG: 4Fe-4S binding protein [Cloacibacillus porcorum]|uniref:4Fe-4S dicluster-binding protein n=1 Tax=Cloacibacillus porcorum TaxID=1197717 RepID=UPI0023F39021|nr:4Fe-4S dicluster-binding protein [Cloacibacillus porcorum]MCD7877997.1 4Fe-4S binding protein [Cloacibacillus porcorum]
MFLLRFTNISHYHNISTFHFKGCLLSEDIEAFRGKALGSIVHHADIDRGRLFKPSLDLIKCSCCGRCAVSCRDAGYQAISLSRGGISIDLDKCTGCGLCYGLCPSEALTPVGVNV